MNIKHGLGISFVLLGIIILIYGNFFSVIEVKQGLNTIRPLNIFYVLGSVFIFLGIISLIISSKKFIAKFNRVIKKV